MKKLMFILIIGFALLFIASPGFSQQANSEKDIRFTIKTNPLSALGGPLFVLWIVPITSEYKVYFEARTTVKQSVQIGLGYLGSSPLVASIGDIGGDTTVNSSGFRGQLWYKFFMTQDKAPAGFYIGPHVSYAFAKMKNSVDPDIYFGATKLNVECVFGYQVITKGGFALDIFTGLGLKHKTYDTSHMGTSETFGDWELNDKFTVSVPFNFSFGYAF
jgi:hypothetical protein